MKKHLLIFTWEYNGYHSKQGTALAKRPRHVAESFNMNGWDVTVIHKDQRNECNERPYMISKETNGVKRISVKQTKDIEYTNNTILRQFETLYYITLHGDRSYEWSKDVIREFDNFGIASKPDLIISFYTPRVPLYLGDHFSKKMNIPWIADLQDPIYEGISQKLQPLCRFWMKGILRSAKAITHVSPEWAKIDGERTGLKIHTIRHAVPRNTTYHNAENNSTPIEIDKETFNIFHGGYISPDFQSLEVFKSVINSFKSADKEIRLLVAADIGMYDYFKQELGDKVARYLGWLDPDAMAQYIRNCNCTLVIPWSKDRVGIPSKFYELCSYGKPIWIIGNDLGSFSSLLKEWKHPDIQFDNLDLQKKTLAAAINNDYSMMFNIENCKANYIKEVDLFDKYIALSCLPKEDIVPLYN